MHTLAIDDIEAAIFGDLMGLAIEGENKEVVVDGVGDGEVRIES